MDYVVYNGCGEDPMMECWGCGMPMPESESVDGFLCEHCYDAQYNNH